MTWSHSVKKKAMIKRNQVAHIKTERKITRINADDYKFNFKINGNLDKEITSGESTINQELELNVKYTNKKENYSLYRLQYRVVSSLDFSIVLLNNPLFS